MYMVSGVRALVRPHTFVEIVSFSRAVVECIHLLQPRGYKTFLCSTQLSMNFILLINVKMPTIDGILIFISRIKTTRESKNQEQSLSISILVVMSSLNLSPAELTRDFFYNLCA